MRKDNVSGYESLNWILQYSREGFFALVASPRTQEEVISRYRDANIAVYDYKEREKHYDFAEIARFVEETPDADAYVLLNLQFALLEPEDMQRLNLSRDALADTDRNFIFCMTRRVERELNLKAVDFYSYLKLRLRFTDETPQNAPAAFAEGEARPKNQSTGLREEIPPDWPERKQLTMAISLSLRARELAKEFRYVDALRLLEQVRRVREEFLDLYDLDLAATYEDLRRVCRAMGNYHDALNWFQKTREIYIRVYGKESVKNLDYFENDPDYFEDDPDFFE